MEIPLDELVAQGWSRRTLLRWAATGKIRARRDGERWMVDEASLRAHTANLLMDLEAWSQAHQGANALREIAKSVRSTALHGLAQACAAFLDAYQQAASSEAGHEVVWAAADAVRDAATRELGTRALWDHVAAAHQAAQERAAAVAGEAEALARDREVEMGATEPDARASA